ncbi:hypothetical protein EDC01DRAFT_494512 [Geopyxis carbonaria]|nr:hypothetical protein EDC01DRAFT_494512 [Geopyxis carbonaria]
MPHIPTITTLLSLLDTVSANTLSQCTIVLDEPVGSTLRTLTLLSHILVRSPTETIGIAALKRSRTDAGETLVVARTPEPTPEFSNHCKTALRHLQALIADPDDETAGNDAEAYITKASAPKVQQRLKMHCKALGGAGEDFWSLVVGAADARRWLARRRDLDEEAVAEMAVFSSVLGRQNRHKRDDVNWEIPATGEAIEQYAPNETENSVSWGFVQDHGLLRLPKYPGFYATPAGRAIYHEHLVTALCNVAYRATAPALLYIRDLAYDSPLLVTHLHYLQQQRPVAPAPDPAAGWDPNIDELLETTTGVQITLAGQQHPTQRRTTPEAARRWLQLVSVHSHALMQLTGPADPARALGLKLRILIDSPLAPVGTDRESALCTHKLLSSLGLPVGAIELFERWLAPRLAGWEGRADACPEALLAAAMAQGHGGHAGGEKWAKTMVAASRRRCPACDVVCTSMGLRTNGWSGVHRPVWIPEGLEGAARTVAEEGIERLRGRVWAVIGALPR